MKCPKCGGEIPFYHLKPNCEHCGVNIMYYAQHEGLTRDAKRSELEAGAARMVIARIKAQFIGSKLVIFRMVFTILAAAALLAPFIETKYHVPLYEGAFSVGIIGVVQGFTGGLLMKLPAFLGSALLAKPTLASFVPAVFFVVIALLDVLILAALIVGFLKLTESAKFMKNTAFVGMIVSAAAQIAVPVMKFTTADTETASVKLGFGALAALAMFLAIFLLNKAVLKKGIEPVYREFDPKRRELLKKVRKGEVDLDSLPLPVFESEEEREERLKALEEALKAEEEGKEQ
ncbi:MAG: hypothetical protein IJK23_11885 [Clostridia bacterium]|nr:hypothetical protein [Clostridia bacterium]